ncbi:MAG: ATP-binding protein [Candidatus Accumulibacter necessarius]|jgi:two-component system sensor histidine kinase GlrK|uniref:sensor histidine kinase n=1 Tax=Candidatus Accumulibacter necessarius TaxID=2954386 RepID=UPI002FC360D0
MIRISFRQSMLAGFLLIASLLGWAAVRSWLVLEQFVDESRRSGEHVLQLSGSIQEIADRTVGLERSARQFAVLNEATLLERFDTNLEHALAAVGRLQSIPGEALGKLARDWRAAAEQLSQGLHRSAPAVELLPLLRRLAEINGELAHAGRLWIDEQNAVRLAQLEHNRLQLTGLVAVTVVGAFVVALAMGWWLSRPIGSIVRVIERLGESRFDTSVAIGGPADLRRVGRRLEWLRQRLGELETDRERTLRHVSHELKTPLTALREGIALLQEQVPGPLEGAQREVVDILQHNVMALQGHIESLLRLNAACFEARRPTYRPLPLRRLLAEVVQGRELQIQTRQLTVLHEAPAITRNLDGDKLLVVVDNLLSNAIDFSPEGGVIRLQAAAFGKSIRISCIDQGPGIAPEDAERIFEPFVQGRLASPTPRQGSGVGLSIVRELMTAMGGQVMLVHGDGLAPGAHFRIEVPCG